MLVKVDFEAARLLGGFLRVLASKTPFDDFTNPDFYPPVNASRREIVSYFLVMVAMDHRLSRPGRPYEAIVDGRLYHGADLLYKLGSKKYAEDPGFFEAEKLSKVNVKDILEWLSVETGGRTVKPPDPEVRAELLRDLGVKLLKLYDGDPYAVIVDSANYLKKGVQGGFINILKTFKAYQDPVEKKNYLLAKFLERRRVLEIVDDHNKEVPVDNHLVRIAIRTGIIDVDPETLEAIALGVEFTEEKDVILRKTARIAYKEAARTANIDPFTLDDTLWSFGRKCCTRENPTCKHTCRTECAKTGGCNGGCPLAETCKAYKNPKYMVPEHNYTNTWWY